MSSSLKRHSPPDEKLQVRFRKVKKDQLNAEFAVTPLRRTELTKQTILGCRLLDIGGGLDRDDVLKVLRNKDNESSLDAHLMELATGDLHKADLDDLVSWLQDYVATTFKIHFSRPETIQASHKQQAMIILRVHIISVNCPDDSIVNTPFGEEIAEIRGELDHQELINGLPVDPRRCIVSVAPHVRESLKLDDVSISLAAVPSNIAQEEPLSIKTHVPGFRLATHEEIKTFVGTGNVHVISESPRLQELLFDSWPVRRLAQGIDIHRASPPGTFDIKTWLLETTYDPAVPSVRPKLIKFPERPYWLLGLISPSGVQSTSQFHSLEEAREATSLLFGLISLHQAQHGRDSFASSAATKAILKEWRSILGLETTDEEPFEMEDCDGHSCDKGKHRCAHRKGVTGSKFHPKEQLFDCRDLFNGLCVSHYVKACLRSAQRDFWPQLESYVRQHDFKKGIITQPMDLIENRASLKRTIFHVDDKTYDLQKVFDAIMGDEPIKVLASLGIHLSADALDEKDLPVVVNGKVQLGLLVARHIAQSKPSLEQVRQYDDAEKGSFEVVGHTLGSCAVGPRWLQGHQSGPLFSWACHLTAIHAQAAIGQGIAGAVPLLAQLQKLIEGFYPVERSYKKTNYKGDVLPNDCQLLSQEGNAVIMEAFDGPLPALKALVNADTPVSVDLERVIKGYQGRTRIPTLEKACDMFNVEVDDVAGKEEIKQLLANMTADLEEAYNLDAETEAKIIADLSQIVDQVEAKYSGFVAVKNSSGMATFVWPETEKTSTIVIWLINVWIRAIFSCDIAATICCGVVVWERGSWWRVATAFLVHLAQAGPNDLVSGLGFDLSGRPHHLLRLSPCGHRRHNSLMFDGPNSGEGSYPDAVNLTFFETANAVPQVWGTNLWLGSLRIQAIKEIIEVSLAPLKEFISRLVRAGVVVIDQEVLDAIFGRPRLLSPRQVVELRKNGLTWSEQIWC